MSSVGSAVETFTILARWQIMFELADPGLEVQCELTMSKGKPQI